MCIEAALSKRAGPGIHNGWVYNNRLDINVDVLKRSFFCVFPDDSSDLVLFHT